MRWVCLLLPHLALDAVLRRCPTPEAPLALVTGPGQRRVLRAVNTSAAALGLRPGLSLTAAHALASTFHTMEYDEVATERCQQLLAGWAYRFSSQVSTVFPRALVLEIGQSMALFGPWPRLEARLRDELNALGFRHRIVAAPNPYAARILANVHDGIGVDENVLERALGQIPIERAGLDAPTATALKRMGLRKLQQVFALPRETITRRFPKSVLPHLDALRGHLAPPLTSYKPPDWFDARIEFEQEVESSQALLFPLRRLTADLGAFLSGRDGGVQRFVLRLEHERCEDSDVAVGLLTPEREPSVLFDLARGRLEQARLPAPVRGLRLLARELPPFVPASHDMFDARPQQTMPWTLLRERLRARLGDEAVATLSLHADHRPEHATTYADRSRQPPQLPEITRPGWLLPHPVPLRDARLSLISGPERIESGWWDGGDVRRDYYVVETTQGQRAWAYCAPGEQGPFMLHGWFA